MIKVIKYYKTSLIVFSVIVFGFMTYKIVFFEVLPPEFYPVGATADEIIPAFEKLGFRFKWADPVYGHKQIIGLSADRKCFVQLIGDNDLVGVKIAVHLSKKMPKSKLTEIRGFFFEMISLVMPHWTGGHQWLEDKTLAIGNSGLRRTTIGNVDVTIRIDSGDGTWGVSFGDWSTLPTYADNMWSSKTK